MLGPVVRTVLVGNPPETRWKTPDVEVETEPVVTMGAAVVVPVVGSP